ncbi:MAG: hypothetical protein QM770_12065 [Tepidisphaeraceae bacterium]
MRADPHADTAVRFEIVDRSKLQVTADPALKAGEVRITSDHTLPIVLQADGRRVYKLPLVLLPRTPSSFTVSVGNRSDTLNLLNANPLPNVWLRFSEDAYTPIASEVARLNTLLVRQYVVLGGVLFACVATGLALLKRGAGTTIAMVSALAVAGVVGWNYSRPTHEVRHAVVEQSGHGNVAKDDWTWLLVRRDATIEWSVPAGPTPRVIAASAEHLRGLSPEFIVNAAGDVRRIRFTARRDTQVAIVVPMAKSSEPKIDPLDLAPLVRDYYRGQEVLSRTPGTWRVRAGLQ